MRDESNPEVSVRCISWGIEVEFVGNSTRISGKQKHRGSTGVEVVLSSFRPLRGGLVPRARLQERVSRFASGEWVDLLRSSLESSLQGARPSLAKSKFGQAWLPCLAKPSLAKLGHSRCRASVQVAKDAGDSDSVPKRVSRAIALANMGELSNARQVLEGDAVAPGNETTWKLLTDENRRPRSVREPLSRRTISTVPPIPVEVDVDLFTKNLRTAHRGLSEVHQVPRQSI